MSAVSWMHCINNRHAEQAIKIPFRGAEASWAFNQVKTPARAPGTVRPDSDEQGVWNIKRRVWSLSSGFTEMTFFFFFLSASSK